MTVEHAANTSHLPADLDMLMEQVRSSAVPLVKALDYVSERAEDSEVPVSEVRVWIATRDLLVAAAARYEDVTAILNGEEVRNLELDESDPEALARNLRGLEQVLAGWKTLTTGKWNASNGTAAIWTDVLARGDRLSSENQAMFAHFDAERRELDRARQRLQSALEYLWRNGRPRPDEPK